MWKGLELTKSSDAFMVKRLQTLVKTRSVFLCDSDVTTWNYKLFKIQGHVKALFPAFMAAYMYIYCINNYIYKHIYILHI